MEIWISGSTMGAVWSDQGYQLKNGGTNVARGTDS
jgi:hypothetical protein